MAQVSGQGPRETEKSEGDGVQGAEPQSTEVTPEQTFRRAFQGVHGLTDLPVVDEEILLGSLKDPSSGLGVAQLLGAAITSEQQMVIEAVHDAARGVAPVSELLRMDREQEFCAGHLAELHSLGMMNLSVPERLGGGGQSFTTEALAVLALAEIDAGVAAAYAANPLALKPILIAGTEGQKLRLVKPLAESGGLASYCQTEPEAGSDFANLKTTITPDGDSYLLNGTKIWATNGAKAELLVVACRVAGTRGRDGITIVVVPHDAPGFEMMSSEDKVGQRLSNAAALAFENVRIPKENVIGEVGAGYGVLLQTLGMARPNVAAIGLGIIQRSMELGYQAVKGREQFGTPILANQGVQFPFADALMKFTSGLLLTMQATRAHDLGLPNASALASMAKLQTSEDARLVAGAMADLHGGTRYSNEAEIAKVVRDADVLPVYEGTSNMQRIILFRAAQGRLG